MLSIVAASVADRVVLQTSQRRVLTPTLYTLLIGPSGSGKDYAIETALPFVRGLANIDIMDGTLSGKALIQEMATRATRQSARTGVLDPSSKLYLVTKELADSIGTGPQAGGFIRAVTALYTQAGGEASYSYRTLSFGAADVNKPCLNWIGASTKEWFRQSVTYEDMKSGFGARTCVIVEDTEWDHVSRLRRPVEPADYWQVADYVSGYLENLSNLCVGDRGYFRMTNEAADLEDRWMQTRAMPQVEEMMPLWRRQQATVLKLAMNLALCDLGKYPIADIAKPVVTIDQHHVRYAVELSDKIFEDMKDLLFLVHGTRDFEEMSTIKHFIREACKGHRGKRPIVTRAKIINQMSHFGVTSDRIDKYLRTLVEGGQIQAIDRRGEVLHCWQGWAYSWVEGVIEVPDLSEMMLSEDEPDETGEYLH